MIKFIDQSDLREFLGKKDIDLQLLQGKTGIINEFSSENLKDNWK